MQNIYNKIVELARARATTIASLPKKKFLFYAACINYCIPTWIIGSPLNKNRTKVSMEDAPHYFTAKMVCIHYASVDLNQDCTERITWDKIFKIGPSKIFKGCLSQYLLGPFLNTLTHICYILFRRYWQALPLTAAS